MHLRVAGTTLAAFATALLVFGCGGGASFSDADRAAVQVAWDGIAAADIAADWDASSALLTDDFVHLDPRVPPLLDQAEWRTWVESMEFGPADGSYTVSEIDGSGDLAYVFWTWSGSWLQGGERQESDSKGLSLFRKEADGSWKLARNAWNRTPSPFEGTWRIVESWGTNTTEGEWRTESVQPSEWIFRGRHYSIMHVRGDDARPLHGEDATRETISSAQMRSTFMTFTANSGTFTVDGSTLTTDPDVALWPDYMESGSTTYTFTIEGNTATLTSEVDGNVTNFRLQRIE